MIENWAIRLPWDHIVSASKKMRVNPLLIGAIVSCESNGDEKAARFEKNYRWLYNPQRYASLNQITLDTEKNMQMSSLGLMQIMGANARVHGFLGPLTDLLDAETGLKYGICHFVKLVDRYESIPDAISAYNQGSPRKKKDGKYANQKYVDKILKRYKYLKDL